MWECLRGISNISYPEKREKYTRGLEHSLFFVCLDNPLWIPKVGMFLGDVGVSHKMAYRLRSSRRTLCVSLPFFNTAWGEDIQPSVVGTYPTKMRPILTGVLNQLLVCRRQ
jgi:hypothetical protein